MAVKLQKPKAQGLKSMFIFWVNTLLQEKPHLIVKHLNTNGKVAQVWYEVKQELEFLRIENLNFDIEIQKLEELEKLEKDKSRFTANTREIYAIKKEISTNNSRIKELIKLPASHRELILDYNKFKEIIISFNRKASDYIIQGENLNLGNRLGYVQIRKIIPTVRSTSRIDWKESLDYKKELIANNEQPKTDEHPNGKNWLIYKNQSFYLRWAWMKRQNRACTVKNNKVYAFYPTASSSSTANGGKVPGNKAKLSAAQAADPLLHTRYTMVKLNGMDSKIITPV